MPFGQVGVHFEPRNSQTRIKLAEFIILLTLVDDTYDAHNRGTQAIYRFSDKRDMCGIEGLPESMRYLNVLYWISLTKLRKI